MSRLVTTVIEEIPTREIQAPPSAPPMSPKDELRLLEKKAVEKGMSHQELDDIRNIGDCHAQVQTRIEGLHEWLAARS